ncbi:MAG: MFS transporter [Actinoallomurus sp.]
MSRARRWPVLTLLGTAFFMTILDGTSLLTALPSIEAGLHLGGPAIQWTVTAYALAFSGPLLLCGRAADLLGRRRMFLTGMVLRMLASLACGFAPSAGILVAGRAAQGLSAAIIAPAALSMVMNTFPEGPERNRALGVWGGIGGIGATAGLLSGGLVTETFGWPWVFWINLPVGAVVLTLAPRLLRESRAPGRGRPVDVAGAVTVTLATTLIVYAITCLPTASGARTTATLAAGAVLAGVFVLVERRAAAPLVPFRALRSRTLIGGNLVVLVAGMAVDGMLITLTSYAQQVLGWSPLRFGLVAAVMTVSAVAGGLVSQRLATGLGVRRPAAAGMALLACACALLTQVSPGRAGLIVIALLVFGAGMGTAAVCGQISALTGIGEEHSGLAAGLADTSFAVGTALGVAICGSVAVAAGPGLPGQRTAFGTAGAFACLGLLAAVALLTRPRVTAAPDAGSRLDVTA